jgi:hypothetical protein
MDCQVDASQRRNFGLAGAIDLGHAAKLDERLGVGH